ncbi:2,3-dihydro-2,3-dihydroxybenzoate dehydrogenase [Rhodobacteraceae bacterium B1Z28]|uniref:2,3-dihydro-2,3-dihydroxybenzoate dehydrogenase n=1 Tax=Ruegeria haliotis TaxID=2747601 RepID=A0ABX2PUK9_9RHOB|nr:2,3-dihydro-2,3-dihydroxybenzoate dehydrogenase [Ruegeria haliotis]NVO57346.1 2,3-dihydro-2,3-dihydroxybenzoate dehydrogenase [Ruegeria haliotis]
MKLTGFEGRVALITGAAGGIGQSLCARLHDAGAVVVATDTAAAMAKTPVPAGVCKKVMDVSDAQQVADIIDWIEHECGPIDLLAHAAGVVAYLRADETTPQDWAHVMKVNATGTFNVCGTVARHMQTRNSGAMAVIGSNAAGIPRHRMAAYAASKAAAHMYVRCLGLELGQSGIRCNLVAPGSTLTPMQTAMWSDEHGADRVIAGDLPSYRTGIPLGKLAEPDDIASAALFLLSEQAGHITMADLYVDGGATLRA